MPFAVASMGVKQVVLRKVDGPEILRRIDQHGVTLLCGAPAVLAAILDAAAGLGMAPFPVAIGFASSVPARRRRRTMIERVETELGWEFIQIYGLTETSPLLTMSRRRAEWDRSFTSRASPKAESRRGAVVGGANENQFRW